MNSPASNSSPVYFVTHNGKKHGPFSIETLISRRLTSDMLVWCQGMENWVPVGSIEQLSPYVVDAGIKQPIGAPPKKPPGGITKNPTSTTAPPMPEVVIQTDNFGSSKGSVDDLRKIAIYQKWLNIGILISLICYFIFIMNVLVQAVLYEMGFEMSVFFATFLVVIWFVVLGVLLLANCCSTLFLFLLGFKVFGIWPGLALGIFSLFPCVGLVPLLIVSIKATSVLRKRGVKVGLLGANPSEIMLG